MSASGPSGPLVYCVTCIWGLLTGVLNQCQQFSRYIKVAFDVILFPNSIWDIFGEVFYNCFRKVQIF